MFLLAASQSTSPREPAVFDTSPLVFLDLLGYVSFLQRLHGRVVLPEAVARELTAHPGLPGSEVPSLEWVERRTPGAESVRHVRREPPALGDGETEAIALGLELSCLVVLDDRRARLRARRAGLRVTGTLGILLRLHRLRLAERELEADIALMEEAGMRLSPELRRAVLDSGAG